MSRTPGTWKVRHNYHYDAKFSTVYTGKMSRTFAVSGGDFVATRIKPDDARLISAAPDLLEALENIENDDGSIPSTIWDMRNAAIAKAKGKKQ